MASLAKPEINMFAALIEITMTYMYIYLYICIYTYIFIYAYLNVYVFIHVKAYVINTHNHITFKYFSLLGFSCRKFLQLT
jgi:hypothetical protein